MAKAISMKGIVRNQSKLVVEDGCSEDLINLRFKDGSWRTSGDGKRVFAIGHTEQGVPSSGKEMYHQLYIHTNVYRHLLGVKENTNSLYWFANIDSDGVFSAVEPMKICDAQGDLEFVQTGNLLTIISKLDNNDNGGVFYALYDEKNKKYKVANIDQNGNQDAKGLYPYGRVHFNLDCSEGGSHQITKDFGEAQNMGAYFNGDECQADGWMYYRKPENWNAALEEAIAKAKESNLFTMPFLAVLAVKLYDGKYAFASNPVLLWPTELRSRMESVNFYLSSPAEYTTTPYTKGAYMISGLATDSASEEKYDNLFLTYNNSLLDASGWGYYNNKPSIILSANGVSWAISNKSSGVHCKNSTPIQYQINGADLVFSISDTSTILQNKELFSGIGIFITRPYDFYDRDNSYTLRYQFNHGDSTGSPVRAHKIDFARHLSSVSNEDIIYHLTTSPFKLLREYDLTEIGAIDGAIKVDLSDPKYKEILKNIDEQDTLQLESMERSTYVPRCAYNYNGRLHLANYKKTSFHGFPYDCFMYNNHPIKIAADKSQKYLGIPALIDDNGATSNSVGKYQRYFGSFQMNPQQLSTSTITEYIQSFISFTVHIETNNGDMKLVRYVAPYTPASNDEYPSFLEKLSPILTYPDNRAKLLDIHVNLVTRENNVNYVQQYKMSVNLKPMSNLNMAYAFKSDLKEYDFTIDSGWSAGTHSAQKVALTSSSVWEEDLTESESVDNVPNGIRVSDALNPLVFPYENTYQVGSSEIIGMCSNATSVGTGQTGAAPLFIFAKDGVYALMVDSSGQMAYTNSRIIARDICNNAKSISPIDGGIVFVTSRGLMTISGQDVVEIGQAAEGKPFDYIDESQETGRIEPKPLIHNILKKIAELPPIVDDESESSSSTEAHYAICDNVDFLEYIKGAIINYNYNMRELYVTNPTLETSGARMGLHKYDYSYVLDRDGNWSRRTLCADEYINNYPTSYRYIDGTLYQIDKDGNANDESNNKFFALSNVIKLDTLDFKKSFRFVARGFFDTYDKANGHWEVVEEQVGPTSSSIVPANYPSSGSYTTKSWVLQEKEMLIEESESSSESSSESETVPRTIYVPTGYVGNLTIQYGGTLSFTMGNYTILDASERNELVVKYVVKKGNKTIFTSDKFFSQIDGNGNISVDLTHPNDIVVLNEGTYTLHLVLESLNLNFDSTTQPTVVTENITAIDNTTIYDQTTSRTNNVLQTKTVTIGANGGRIDMTFSGFTDYVCGKVTGSDNRICKFDSTHTNVIKIKYAIYDSNNTQLFLKEFVGEQLDDYTIRVYLSNHDTEEESESSSSSESTTEILTPISAILDNLGQGTYTLKLLQDMDVKLETMNPEINTTQFDIRGSLEGHTGFSRTASSGTIQINEWADVLSPFGIAGFGFFGYEMINAIGNQYKDYTLKIDSNSTTSTSFDQCQVIIEIQDRNATFTSTGVNSPYIALYDLDSQSEVGGPSYRLPCMTPTELPGSTTNYAKWGLNFESQSVTIPNNLLNKNHRYVFRLKIIMNISTTSTTSILFKPLTPYSPNNKFIVTSTKKIFYKLNEVNPSETELQRKIVNVCTSNKIDIIQYTGLNNLSVTNALATFIPESRTWVEGDAKTSYVGVYLLGSYDGRKWMILGGNEDHGKFTDIGCLTERTDVKYLRYVFAGNVKGDSRLDYFEIEGRESNLSTKIR